MRVVKDPEVRRGEILDAAEHLFATKGYAKTTIVDILDANGIAKGTFYHYFKSKEAVMDAVIARVVESDVVRARAVAANPGLSPAEKLKQVVLAIQLEQGSKKDRMLEQFHQPGNAEMHQKSLALGIRGIVPILTAVVVEGVAKGVFNTPYPGEVMEFLMVAGQIIFDEGIFQWAPEERAGRLQAFTHIMETTLGAEPGSLGFFDQILGEKPPDTR